MTTTQDADKVRAARQEILERIERLSLEQLEQILSVISSMEAQADHTSQEAGGEAFIERMRALREEFHVTDEEFDQFDRILRESDEAEKRRLTSSPHE